MCDTCLRICNAIGELNSDEGNSVTIMSDNPEFTGANSAIEVIGDYTKWKPSRFEGDSVCGALEKAVEYKKQWNNKGNLE